MQHKEGKVALPDTRTYDKAIKLCCNHRTLDQWNRTGSSETESHVEKLDNGKGGIWRKDAYSINDSETTDHLFERTKVSFWHLSFTKTNSSWNKGKIVKEMKIQESIFTV